MSATERRVIVDAASRPVCVLLCALGGEGGGVLAEWLYGAAVRAGLRAQSTSVPGVAQRTGATTYYLEVCPVHASALGEREPLFGLAPVAGQVDLLVGSELLETARQVALGMASPERTGIVTTGARTLTVVEKMQPADGRVPSERLLHAVRAQARWIELLDFEGHARRAATAVSAPLLGAIAASGVLPIPREAFESQIRAGSAGAAGAGIEASLRGFASAFEEVEARRGTMRRVAEERTTTRPPEAASLRDLARTRLAAYQSPAYAALYDRRVDRIHAAEQAADAQGAEHGAATTEVVRWLALWMAFDDIVHVARLKLAASRLERVRRETRAGPDDVLKVFDHFKPGVAEFAALLPDGLARRLVAWDRRRIAAGAEPWAWPMKIGAHTVTGAASLAMLAALRRWRPHGSRWRHEQALIERWLAAVERGLQEAWPLGHELAQCGRLVKGYGSTNERGKDTLLHLLDHVAFGAAPAHARGEAVRRARLAALADGSGQALDEALHAHGAPPRVPREQPVRWMRRAGGPPSASRGPR